MPNTQFWLNLTIYNLLYYLFSHFFSSLCIVNLDSFARSFTTAIAMTRIPAISKGLPLLGSTLGCHQVIYLYHEQREKSDDECTHSQGYIYIHYKYVYL